MEFVVRTSLGEANPDSKAVRGRHAKNQHLLFEIRSSATDTEDKAAKLLTCADLSALEAIYPRNRIPNAYAM